jgi:hypothetical protein
MPEKEDKELEAAKVFFRNFTKASEKTSKTREHACNSNCDCYIELEPLQAAGIGGYRIGM